MNNYSEDPYNLNRFISAQDPVYDQVRSELRQGFKMTHWIWFIFPQIKGLSLSSTSQTFSISSLEEAVSYANHPVLGPRLLECTHLVTNVSGKTIKQILGFTDSTKFRSSMTLFAYAATDSPLFKEALKKYFSGQYDQLTIDKLQAKCYE